MRGAPAILAALLLAACSVDVEGARCRVAGATEDCPSGQACGNDLTCSERALACEAAGTRCAPGAARCADSDAVERCAASDPACGAWEVEDCAAAGLACGDRSGAAACECPAYGGPAFWADPVGGSRAGALPFPTGASAPAACRFGRLGDGLERAASYAASTGAAAAVQPFAAGPSVFGDVATGEAFPLVVPENVHLLGAAGEVGPVVVRAEGASAAALVHVRGWLSGVRVESAPTALVGGGLLAATGTGVLATCGAGAAPWMAEVEVVGGGTLGKGVDVDVAAGACGATLMDVEVSGVAGPALAVSADAAAAGRVQVRGGTFRDSAVGIRATGGQLSLGSESVLGAELGAIVADDAVEVTGNAGDGVVLSGDGARTIDAELLGARITGNGGTGVVLESVSPSSRLVVRACVVFANGDTAPRAYGGAAQRTVGGVLVRQLSLAAPLAFLENRVSANAGDQLAFDTSGAWSISPGACARANVFGCVAPGAYAVGVKGGGSVDASFTVWPTIPWSDLASASVTAPSAAYCNGEDGAPEPPPAASCPAP